MLDRDTAMNVQDNLVRPKSLATERHDGVGITE
jgi:hypothetical protein